MERLIITKNKQRNDRKKGIWKRVKNTVLESNIINYNQIYCNVQTVVSVSNIKKLKSFLIFKRDWW